MSNIPLIVGAGPTGLFLALVLTRMGVRVRLIDKASAPGTSSRALVVHARTLEFYRQMGIADRIVKESFKFAAANIWAFGKKAGRIQLGDIGSGLSAFPYMLIYPQDEHEKFLIAELLKAGVEVERGVELLSLSQTADEVSAKLRRADGTEEIFKTPYLAGCDGSHSVVRKSFQQEFSGSTYSQLFYVADVEAQGAATDGELHLAIDEADFLAIFPLKGAGHARLIGVVTPEAEKQKEKITWDDVKHEALDRLRLNVKKVNWFSTYSVHHRLAAEFQKGRVFLLGDAGHIHSPVGGQGMNTGLGDAMNLGWKLGSVLTKLSREKILLSYEPERRAFAKRLVATTDRAFTIISSDGALARFIRLRVVPFIIPRLGKAGYFRRLMFRTVSQISINYRVSPLSRGPDGRLSPGDRMPWLYENDLAFTGFSWQAHIYGEPEEDLGETCERLGIVIHIYKWRRDFTKSGLRKNALYLLRPDMHIGLISPLATKSSIAEYFKENL